MLCGADLSKFVYNAIALITQALYCHRCFA